ncbi:hypothetical protein CEXT_156921 [Caerostris extrusa]|uniref:Uncharacterized protein n=1 Tax=Caerostris extrusa TaxID=172846 RepID=A0AAV4P2K7_CAEEX|nr:hypothetical protein CEXT_156921 [Caerostris extrusa]
MGSTGSMGTAMYDMGSTGSMGTAIHALGSAGSLKAGWRIIKGLPRKAPTSQAGLVRSTVVQPESCQLRFPRATCFSVSGALFTTLDGLPSLMSQHGDISGGGWPRGPLFPPLRQPTPKAEEPPSSPCCLKTILSLIWLLFLNKIRERFP